MRDLRDAIALATFGAIPITEIVRNRDGHEAGASPAHDGERRRCEFHIFFRNHALEDEVRLRCRPVRFGSALCLPEAGTGAPGGLRYKTSSWLATALRDMCAVRLLHLRRLSAEGRVTCATARQHLGPPRGEESCGPSEVRTFARWVSGIGATTASTLELEGCRVSGRVHALRVRQPKGPCVCELESDGAGGGGPPQTGRTLRGTRLVPLSAASVRVRRRDFENVLHTVGILLTITHTKPANDRPPGLLARRAVRVYTGAPRRRASPVAGVASSRAPYPRRRRESENESPDSSSQNRAGRSAHFARRRR